MLNEWLSSLPPEVTELLGYSRLAGALLIVLVGLLAARLVQAVVKGLFLRLAIKTKSRLDEDILNLMHQPLWQTVVLISAGLAVVWLRPGERPQYLLVGLIETTIVAIWLVALMRLTTLIFGEIGRRLTEARKGGADLIPLLANIMRVLIITAAAFAVLTVWKVDITPLLASAGIAGLAVALAAKDTLANFFGGISVFMDRPYKIGDYINLSSGERGEVVDIGIRSTRIQTRDDIQIIIPNSLIASAKIINESAPQPLFRTRIKVGVAYGSDMDQVENILLQVAEDCSMVVENPEPRVRFRNFGDSALEVELLCWLGDPRDRGRAVHGLNKAVYKAFNQNGVTIPFPQLDLHVIGK